MITQFNEFINEGFFSSENDKYLKEFFKEIKENFDFDNFKADDDTYRYIHDGIKLYLRLYYSGGFFKSIIIKIDNEEINCSKLLKFKIFTFFNSKKREMDKLKKIKESEKLKDKLDPVNRTSKKYNM